MNKGMNIINPRDKLGLLDISFKSDLPAGFFLDFFCSHYFDVAVVVVLVGVARFCFCCCFYHLFVDVVFVAVVFAAVAVVAVSIS